MNFQTDEKSNKMVSKIYLRKLLSAHFPFAINLPSLDTLAHFLGHAAVMTPLKHSNI